MVPTQIIQDNFPILTSITLIVSAKSLFPCSVTYSQKIGVDIFGRGHYSAGSSLPPVPQRCTSLPNKKCILPTQGLQSSYPKAPYLIWISSVQKSIIWIIYIVYGWGSGCNLLNPTPEAQFLAISGPVTLKKQFICSQQTMMGQAEVTVIDIPVQMGEMESKMESLDQCSFKIQLGKLH